MKLETSTERVRELVVESAQKFGVDGEKAALVALSVAYELALDGRDASYRSAVRRADKAGLGKPKRSR